FNQIRKLQLEFVCRPYIVRICESNQTPLCMLATPIACGCWTFICLVEIASCFRKTEAHSCRTICRTVVTNNDLTSRRLLRKYALNRFAQKLLAVEDGYHYAD